MYLFLESFLFVLYYYGVLYYLKISLCILLYYNYPLEAFFLMRERKRVDIDGRKGGEELGGIQ